MIQLMTDMATEYRENMRGGQGTIAITNIFNKHDFKANCRLCAKITIQPGDSIGFHEHVNEEELYLIIQGKALVNDNGHEKELHAGDAILTGNGTGHAIQNIGLQPLELIAIILVYA